MFISFTLYMFWWDWLTNALFYVKVKWPGPASFVSQDMNCLVSWIPLYSNPGSQSEESKKLGIVLNPVNTSTCFSTVLDNPLFTSFTLLCLPVIVPQFLLWQQLNVKKVTCHLVRPKLTLISWLKECKCLGCPGCLKGIVKCYQMHMLCIYSGMER